MSELADRTIDADHRTYQRLARLVGTLTDDDLATRVGCVRVDGRPGAVPPRQRRGDHAGDPARRAGGDRAARRREPGRLGPVERHEPAGAGRRVPARRRGARPGLRGAGPGAAETACGSRWPSSRSRPTSTCSPGCGSTRRRSTPGTSRSRSTARPPSRTTSPPSWSSSTAGPLAFLLGFAGKPAELDGPATLTVRATSPDMTLGLTLGGPGPADRRARAESDGELHLPAEALPRLLTGRLRAADEERGVRVDGAVSLDDLRRVFPGL